MKAPGARRRARVGAVALAPVLLVVCAPLGGEVESADLAERAEIVPLVRGKLAQGGRATAYVCERQVCRRPTSDPAVFAQQIRTRSAGPGAPLRAPPGWPHSE